MASSSGTFSRIAPTTGYASIQNIDLAPDSAYAANSMRNYWITKNISNVMKGKAPLYHRLMNKIPNSMYVLNGPDYARPIRLNRELYGRNVTVFVASSNGDTVIADTACSLGNTITIAFGSATSTAGLTRSQRIGDCKAHDILHFTYNSSGTVYRLVIYVTTVTANTSIAGTIIYGTSDTFTTVYPIGYDGGSHTFTLGYGEYTMPIIGCAYGERDSAPSAGSYEVTQNMWNSTQNFMKTYDWTRYEDLSLPEEVSARKEAYMRDVVLQVEHSILFGHRPEGMNLPKSSAGGEYTNGLWGNANGSKNGMTMGLEQMIYLNPTGPGNVSRVITYTSDASITTQVYSRDMGRIYKFGNDTVKDCYTSNDVIAYWNYKARAFGDVQMQQMEDYLGMNVSQLKYGNRTMNLIEHPFLTDTQDHRMFIVDMDNIELLTLFPMTDNVKDPQNGSNLSTHYVSCEMGTLFGPDPYAHAIIDLRQIVTS